MQSAQPQLWGDDQYDSRDGKCIEKSDDEQGDQPVQAATYPEPENRDQCHTQVDKNGGESLDVHHPQVHSQRFKKPIFVEALDDVSEYLKASYGSRYVHNNPANDCVYRIVF